MKRQLPIRILVDRGAVEAAARYDEAEGGALVNATIQIRGGTIAPGYAEIMPGDEPGTLVVVWDDGIEPPKRRDLAKQPKVLEVQ